MSTTTLFRNVLIKRKWTITAIAFALLLVPLTIGKAMAYDEPRYMVIDTRNNAALKDLPKGVELRQYDPMMVAELNIGAKNWNSAARQAFRPLANFIFGSNDRDEKIGMTIPVTTHSNQVDQWTVAFVMPNRYNQNNLPKPYGEEIGISTRPAKLMATIRFSGRIGGNAGEQNFKKAEEKLRMALEAAGIAATGPAIYAVYNGPFTPFFFRRNEVLLQIKASGVSSKHDTTTGNDNANQVIQ